MNFELFVALRYLRARRKQAFISLVTVISVVGVAAGVVALNVALALNNGFREEFQARILGATSHVNLVGPSEGIARFDALAERVSAHPEVRSVLPTVYEMALLQGTRRRSAALLKGISLEPGHGFADLLASINLVEGSLETFRRGGRPAPIILGRDLANTLTASAGEQLIVLGSGGELSPVGRIARRERFQVAGIFESGLYEIDANWALIPLEAAQDFVGMQPDRASAVEIRIADADRAAEVADELRRDYGAPDLTVSTWMDLNRPLFSALRLERLAMAIAIGLIVLVASLNIVSTLTLMVMEKSRDIAILSAMGATSGTINRIFMTQGVVIGVIGTILGDIFGTIAIWYLDAFQVIELDQEVYSIPYVPFRQDPFDLVIISVAAVAISFLATLYPARSAAGLDPVEGLRYE